MLPKLIKDCQAVVVCDYGSGTLGEPLVPVLAPNSDCSRPFIVVDAHDPRPWAWLKPDVITPNAQEAAAVLGLRLEHGADRLAAFTGHANELLSGTGAAAAVVTFDRDGSVLLNGDGSTHRTWARRATEKQASGAGDTFVAALTLGRAAGLPLTTSVDLAQAAAHVVVRRFGTSVCSTAELARHLDTLADQAIEAPELGVRMAAARAAGPSTRSVTEPGCSQR